jgi:hypothetical protein
MITKEQQTFRATFSDTGGTFNAKISEGAGDRAEGYLEGYRDGYNAGGNVGTSIRIADVTLLASAWEGSDRLWHQVVTIEGTTEYSQVDLTPSAEQLTIFHEKDIAFTTENEDGTVTVFAIGDKPSNDYVIQATITEVSL